MKKKDFLLIAVVIFCSAVFSYVISSYLFKTKPKQQKVEVVTPITNDFQPPSDKYFNSNSVNPTQIIRIGDGNNASPFNSSN